MLLLELLDEFIVDDNGICVVDVFVDELDLVLLGFSGVWLVEIGWLGYYLVVFLKIYIYGYLNCV